MAAHAFSFRRPESSPWYLVQDSSCHTCRQPIVFQAEIPQEERGRSVRDRTPLLPVEMAQQGLPEEPVPVCQTAELCSKKTRNHLAACCVLVNQVPLVTLSFWDALFSQSSNSVSLLLFELFSFFHCLHFNALA